MSVRFRKMLCALLVLVMIAVTGCSSSTDADNSSSETEKAGSVSAVNDAEYTLEEMVILARHNVRAPLSTEGSDLYKMTTGQWCEWTSNASELSMRGGELETELGQYFRKYLAEKGLFEENTIPEEGQVRIYANSKQRTISTAAFFASALFPLANLDVEYHEEINAMDPVFNPQLTFVSDAYNAQVLNEIASMGGENGLNGIEEGLKENYELLETVLDFKNSDYAKENNITEFAVDDLQISLELNKEPAMSGSLKTAGSAADALVLQYYETEDEAEAAFGQDLSWDQWQMIANIKETYQKVLMTAPSVAVNIAHPLLQEIRTELSDSERKLTFLCGHDSNLSSVLTALQAEEYELPGSLEETTPIGSMIVMEKWKSNDSDEEFVSFKLVYMSSDQLRGLQVLDLNDPPMVYDLSFSGMEKNADGMYPYDSVMERFDEAIQAYDDMVNQYQ